jgi:phospholipid/cholesterol/gamma-HCH transport system substrate-binding protein
MTSFATRHRVLIGAISIAVIVGIALAALNYEKLPFINPGKHYSAIFAEAGGLRSGAAVQVAGYRVGEVTSVELVGAQVLVSFTAAKDIDLGDRSEAAIKTKSLLGAKVLNVIPRGDGHLEGPIPLERTTSPYQLPDALGDLSATISGLNTTDVSDALSTLSKTFQDTPADLQLALGGISRYSQTLNTRDAQLRNLLADANKATAVLAQRANQVVGIVGASNELLQALLSQSAALNDVFGHLSAVAQQLSGFIADNKAQLRPALDKLNGVLKILDDRKKLLQAAIKNLNDFALSLGEVVASGPFFKAYLANLIPGQFIQPFVDAAFSDLGVDPHTLLPSQLTDPQTGQPGTPALPVPFPRTGQGGDPRLTLPDAITGNPGDPRYPYREPPPAPPPGGPPPGPPAPPVGADAIPPPPAPTPVLVQAPGEVDGNGAQPSTGASQ